MDIMNRRPDSENWQRWSPPPPVVHHHQQPPPPQHYSMVPQYSVHHSYIYHPRYPPPHHQAHHAPSEVKHYDTLSYSSLPEQQVHGLPEPLHQAHQTHHPPPEIKHYLPENRPMVDTLYTGLSEQVHGLPESHQQAHHPPTEVKHYLPENRPVIDTLSYPSLPEQQVQVQGLPEPLHQVQGPGPVPAHVRETPVPLVREPSPVVKVEPLTPENRYATQYMASNPVSLSVDNSQATVAASSQAATTSTSAANTAYDTHIDRLMKVIQQRSDGTGTTEGDAKPAQPTKSRGNRSGNGSGTIRKRVRTDPGESLDKPHACQRKRCTKRFSQITHLHIHERAHTGERPHQCTFAGCDKRFTQKGNLRTHERRHLGERPFKCHIPGCTRAFPQKGNLAAHLETHYKRNLFRCILKACNKTFSSRGNLKTHQNNYHQDDLRQLELKFSNILSMTEMTPKDRELWDYFLTVHKNSNKGIKGRGKECRVELVNHAANAPLPPPQHAHQYPLHAPVELQQHAPFPISHSLPNSMGFSHFSMQRPNLGQDFLVTRGGHGYDVYEMDQASISSGTMTPASSPGGMYEDQHHHRSLPYHNRMY